MDRHQRAVRELDELLGPVVIDDARYFDAIATPASKRRPLTAWLLELLADVADRIARVVGGHPIPHDAVALHPSVSSKARSTECRPTSPH